MYVFPPYFYYSCHVASSDSMPHKSHLHFYVKGKAAGVEALIRKRHCPELLDIDGESCHHISNCVQHFTKPFENHTETLFSLLHKDFQYDNEQLKMLEEVICLFICC